MKGSRTSYYVCCSSTSSTRPKGYIPGLPGTTALSLECGIGRGTVCRPDVGRRSIYCNISDLGKVVEGHVRGIDWCEGIDGWVRGHVKVWIRRSIKYFCCI